MDPCFHGVYVMSNTCTLFCILSLSQVRIWVAVAFPISLTWRRLCGETPSRSAVCETLRPARQPRLNHGHLNLLSCDWLIFELVSGWTGATNKVDTSKPSGGRLNTNTHTLTLVFSKDKITEHTTFVSSTNGSFLRCCHLSAVYQVSFPEELLNWHREAWTALHPSANMITQQHKIWGYTQYLP